MLNTFMTIVLDFFVILISYLVFKNIISGPMRHKIYEKFLGSFSSFVIWIFVVTLIITGVTSFIIYKTRYIPYLNIISPAIVSILVGFIMSTIPTRGVEQNKKI